MLLPAWRHHTIISIWAPASRDTAQGDCAPRIRNMLPEYQSIFFNSLCISHRISQYVPEKIFREYTLFLSFPEKSLFGQGDLDGLICYWWAQVCKLHYNKCYPDYSSCTSVTISLSEHETQMFLVIFFTDIFDATLCITTEVLVISCSAREPLLRFSAAITINVYCISSQSQIYL